MNDQEQESLDPRDPGDPLWKLLGASRRIEPSPFFARNVLREIRTSGGRETALFGLRNLFQLHRGFAWAGACVLAVAVLVPFLPRGGGETPLAGSFSSSPETRQEIFNPASEMVAIEYLGQLMAVADPGQLDDEALADLFF